MRQVRRFFSRVINLLAWTADSLRWKYCRSFPSRAGRMRCDLRAAIGVTTFLNRFENHFMPLIGKLSLLFPGARIIVAANGSVLREQQQEYLVRLREFCGRFRNIELITYDEPRGLSHLWNRIMQQAGDDGVLMLNDDLRLKTWFGRFVCRSGITDEQIATINSSWSHFFISQKIFRMTGEFDEELREVGGEDDDYLARLALQGMRPADYRCSAVARSRKRRSKGTELNSYGKDMTTEAYGYSSGNTGYLMSKWEISDEYFEGAVEIPRTRHRFWKLREHRSAR
jgi:hypothetical protein